MTARNDTTQRTVVAPQHARVFAEYRDGAIYLCIAEHGYHVYPVSAEPAAFIVEACNSFDTLRAQNAVLREAMERISSALEIAGEYSGGAQVARNIAGAALQQSYWLAAHDADSAGRRKAQLQLHQHLPGAVPKPA